MTKVASQHNGIIRDVRFVDVDDSLAVILTILLQTLVRKMFRMEREKRLTARRQEEQACLKEQERRRKRRRRYAPMHVLVR